MKFDFRPATACALAIGLGMGATPASAATLIARFTGVVTQSVSDHTFGAVNLVGMTYTADYAFDPTLGSTSVYAPGGGVFDYIRAGYSGASPVQTLSITINGITDVIDFRAPSSSYSSTERFNNPAGPYATLHFGGQAGRVVPSPTGGTANDFAQVGSNAAAGAEIPFDMDQPWNPGPVTGVSGFQRQVQNAGRGYDQAYNIQGTVTGVRITSAAPEPFGWALMITGFGASGAMLRRRRTATD